MSHERYRGPRNRVSVWNWIGTLILISIPGVNILALFLFAFLAKSPSKRNFAAAALWLLLIATILTFAAFLVFPAELRAFADWLRAQAVPVEAIVPTVS